MAYVRRPFRAFAGACLLFAALILYFGAGVPSHAAGTALTIEEMNTERVLGVMKKEYLYRKTMDEAVCRKEILEDFKAHNRKNPLYQGGPDKKGTHCFDVHSTLLSPDEIKFMQEQMAGHFAGVGAVLKPEITEKEIDTPDGKQTILEVSPKVIIEETMKGSPAQAAGIQKGDVIVSVRQNGETAATPVTDIDGAVKLIRGPVGTKVFLMIDRGGTLREYGIVRADIQTPSVEFGKVNVPELGDVGYVLVNSFGEKTADEMMVALRGFKRTDGLKPKVVIDLRWNPGGELFSALEALFQFSSVSTDRLLTVEQGNGTREVNTIDSLRGVFTDPTTCTTINTPLGILPAGCKKKNPGEFAGWHIVILINKGSASASEIFAGTMKDWSDHYPVRIVGETSFGKGVGQSVMGLPSRWGLKLTTFGFKVGNAETPIEGIGVEPDVVVKDTIKSRDELRTDKDAVWMQALSELAVQSW